MKKENIDRVWLTDKAVFIRTKDGKEASECFANYPALKNATKEQLENFRLSVFGIHWDDLDEDLCFEGFFSEKQTA